MGNALVGTYANHIGASAMNAAIGSGGPLTWDRSTGSYVSSNRVAADEALAKVQDCFL